MSDLVSMSPHELSRAEVMQQLKAKRITQAQAGEHLGVTVRQVKRLQRPGARRRAIKREYGGLTERERDIAALVGQGRSNRAIAAALVLSERTVEKHVSNVLGKLGLETRGQVVAWARKNGLSPKTPD